MSQENTDVVNRAISAINERDVDAYLALCTPDVEVINPVTAIEGPIRGEQGILAMSQENFEIVCRCIEAWAGSPHGALRIPPR
jgi:hypothetical protein